MSDTTERDEIVEAAAREHYRLFHLNIRLAKAQGWRIEPDEVFSDTYRVYDDYGDEVTERRHRNSTEAWRDALSLYNWFGNAQDAITLADEWLDRRHTWTLARSFSGKGVVARIMRDDGDVLHRAEAPTPAEALGRALLAYLDARDGGG